MTGKNHQWKLKLSKCMMRIRMFACFKVKPPTINFSTAKGKKKKTVALQWKTYFPHHNQVTKLVPVIKQLVSRCAKNSLWYSC